MFNCAACNLDFTTKRGLESHYKTKKHFSGNADKKFKCDCGRSFSFRQGLHNHKQSCTYVAVNNDEENSEIESQSSQVISIDTRVSQIESVLRKKTEELTDVLSRLSQLEKVKTSVSQLEAKIKRQPTIIYQDNKRCKIPDHVRLDVCTKQNGQCKGCDQVLGDFFQLDHIVALRFGGTNDDSNLQALCGQCHNEKSALESIHRLEIQEAVSTILEKHKESRRLNMATS